MNCAWVKSQIPLYLYNELDDPERVELEQHLEQCPECTAEVEDERRLHQALSARPRRTVDPNFLTACRIQLSEALEREPKHARLWPRLVGAFAGLRISFQPTFAALLLVAGFVGGWVLSTYRDRLPESVPEVLRNSAAPFDLANVSSIHAIHSDPNGGLAVEFDTTRRRVLRGTPDDPRMEQLLVFAARNYSNPGIRLDSIEALKDRAGDLEIRGALVSALRTDRNPGVRLKALEALKSRAADEQVKQALLDVMRHDDNAGVRIEAINQLSKLQDRSTVPLLQELAAGDPNRYVRLRSASALRELNASEIF